MDTDRTTLEAQANLFNLGGNPYPGRGIVAGMSGDGRYLVQVYWIMGRSENSRNRIFSAEDGRLYTEAADPAKMQDPSLVIYNAMWERDPHYVVSNGSQSGAVASWLQLRSTPSLQLALQEWAYEPDAPNYTQRITAMSSFGILGPVIQMAVQRRSRFNISCDESVYTFTGVEPGFGFCITTYAGDGDPLPPFRGDPLIMPLSGGIEEVAETYWGALYEANRVALAVKFIDFDRRSRMHIINKYRKVAG